MILALIGLNRWTFAVILALIGLNRWNFAVILALLGLVPYYGVNSRVADRPAAAHSLCGRERARTVPLCKFLSRVFHVGALHVKDPPSR